MQKRTIRNKISINESQRKEKNGKIQNRRD